MPNKHTAELIAHLRETGTGKEKLAIIESLGESCKTADEFLAACKAKLPGGTVAKIMAFVETKR